MIQSDQLVEVKNLTTMSEFDALKRISSYVAKNRLKVALEAEIPHMDVEANELEVFEVSQRISVGTTPIEESQSAGPRNDGREDQRLDCIYDDEPLDFEKDPSASTTKMQPRDPLEEIHFGDGTTKRPTYISANIDPKLRLEITNILHELKDFFSWDYNEIPGLSRELVELKLPMKPG